VLTSLTEQGPASQAALGRRLWIDRSDLHAIHNEPEGDGLIERPATSMTPAETSWPSPGGA
jgi:DNA-binding MarR family transcriptional regulator